jgi:Tol biopolymer transport system component
VAGGPPVRLDHELAQSESFQISPDSRYVVFAAAREPGVDGAGDIYSVPIQGGVPARLNDEAGAAISFSRFLISPDSQSVLFGNLYMAPITGGARRQLDIPGEAGNAGTPILDYPTSPAISPDSRWVVYLADKSGSASIELYSAPLAGGPAVKLNGPLAEGEKILSFFISPDSRRVLYRQGQWENQSAQTYYSVSIEGGAPTRFPAWQWLHLSQDGRWLVYGTPVATGTGYELYSIPSDGGAPIRLNPPLAEGDSIDFSIISPDSRMVLYATSKEAGAYEVVSDGLYLVPIGSGRVVELTGLAGRDGVYDFRFTPDSSTILANIDYDGDHNPAVYAFTPGSGPVFKVLYTSHPPLYLPWIQR